VSAESIDDIPERLNGSERRNKDGELRCLRLVRVNEWGQKGRSEKDQLGIADANRETSAKKSRS